MLETELAKYDYPDEANDRRETRLLLMEPSDSGEPDWTGLIRKQQTGSGDVTLTNFCFFPLPHVTKANSSEQTRRFTVLFVQVTRC